MPEQYLVVDRLKLGYEGLFNAAELYNLIVSYFREKGYEWFEGMNQEEVTPQGKQIKIIMHPFRKASDYYRLLIRIKLHLLDVKEVEVEQDGQTLHVNHGVVRLIIDAYVVSDRKGKWTGKPFFWFLSIMFDQYLFRSHFSKFETWVQGDVEELHHRIKEYLNVCKYTYQK